MTAGVRRAGAIGVAIAAAAAIALAQPDPGAGSAAPGTGSASSADPGTGSASSADPGTGSANSADPGAGSANSADPGAGSANSADPGAGSAGSAGSGSAVVIQLPTDASAPQVSAAASPTIVRLGGAFTVFIKATFAEGVEVNLREPIELGSIFEVTRKLTEDTPAGAGRKTREWQLEVLAWELGDLVMPPISITYTAYGRAGQVQTNAIRLKVIGVLGDVLDDPKAVREQAPPAELLRRDWFWLWIAGGGAAALAALIALVVWQRRRRRRTVALVAGVVAAPRKMDGPSARALEKLLAIEQAGTLDRDDDRKRGYTEMVEVLREYLGARYRVAMADLTTRELLRELARVAPAEERELVETWLAQCDLVKYGGLRASRAEARRTLDDARALVVTTTGAATAGRAAA